MARVENKKCALRQLCRWKPLSASENFARSLRKRGSSPAAFRQSILSRKMNGRKEALDLILSILEHIMEVGFSLLGKALSWLHPLLYRGP